MNSRLRALILLALSATLLLAGESKAPVIANGPFKPTWESLARYEAPEWFRDAKFGIWAHWGPQCQPERGDWYARHMYLSNNPPPWAADVYTYHVKTYGHPSKFGFKDIIRSWKAENWDPDKLIALYKRAGAQYFFALANHHDNFDLWDSQYQPWNSVRIGPHKNIIAGWAKAARAQGLRFGVSVHAAHAWTWYEPAQLSDKTGPLAGVPYDGKLTKADGAGQWWEGLDPQDLYAQNHPLSANAEDPTALFGQWDWGNGATPPDAAYCEKFMRRTLDLIDKYHPDLVYFDDTVLPLYPVSDVGLRIAAHYYNRSCEWHNGKMESVLFGKVLNEQQRKCLTWDVERGAPNEIQAAPWQTCTCIGDWHYNRGRFEGHSYKTSKTVIQTLADIVSKNGNLLLSIPVRGDGTIDADEIAVVEGIARWMDVNRECIFGTRPWKIYGEGPSVESTAALSAQGFNEGKNKPYTAEDVRFTTKGDVLYAIFLERPADGKVTIKSLAAGDGAKPGLLDREIEALTVLGPHQAPVWTRDAAGLRVTLPEMQPMAETVFAIKVVLR